MYDHRDLAGLQARSLRLQEWIRKQTYSPENEKVLRRFSEWEAAEFILRIEPETLRAALKADRGLPQGRASVEGGSLGAYRWFSFEDLEAFRNKLRPEGRDLRPARPAGKRAVRAAVANFKGGAGKSTVALHYAHAAALDGYRVLLVDCDPQATLSHAMGLTETEEDATVWGIMARDLARETRRMNAAPAAAASGLKPPERKIPEAIAEMGLETRDPADFIRPTAWPAIDMIPSCANAAFVEFATAQYRHLNPDWAFFAALSRYLDALTDDAFDLILFDCPPAIGYQSMNAVFAADALIIPTGPGYWEYDSTTSFIGQLSEALEDLAAGQDSFETGRIPLPKQFAALKVLLTRYEPGNALHEAMRGAFAQVFGDRLCEHAVEHTRAVEQSGRFLCSVYEMDYRDMTRETWKRARRSFDRAWAEFHGVMLEAWEAIEASPARFPAGKDVSGQDGSAAQESCKNLFPDSPQTSPEDAA
ncbi:MAG: AAA family ATPase [Pseudomonadota bacterium]